MSRSSLASTLRESKRNSLLLRRRTKRRLVEELPTGGLDSCSMCQAKEGLVLERVLSAQRTHGQAPGSSRLAHHASTHCEDCTDGETTRRCACCRGEPSARSQPTPHPTTPTTPPCLRLTSTRQHQVLVRINTKSPCHSQRLGLAVVSQNVGSSRKRQPPWYSSVIPRRRLAELLCVR
jgi:hypothetical protein